MIRVVLAKRFEITTLVAGPRANALAWTMKHNQSSMYAEKTVNLDTILTVSMMEIVGEA